MEEKSPEQIALEAFLAKMANKIDKIENAIIELAARLESGIWQGTGEEVGRILDK